MTTGAATKFMEKLVAMILEVKNGGRPALGSPRRWLVLCAVVAAVFCQVVQAQPSPLMEEGFNYPAGTALAANPPWTGTADASLEIIGGSLTQANLRNTIPAGNMLQITGGRGLSVYRDFSSNSISSGAVYFSALVQCGQLPTSSQFVLSLMSAGSTVPDQSSDPVDVYATPAAGGYYLRIRDAGSDSSTAQVLLTANTIHFVVVKFTFGSSGSASLFVDPTPGLAEPLPNASASLDDDELGGGPANLQGVAFGSASSSSSGIFNFDTVRVGTAWGDVTSAIQPLALMGPDDQAVCNGSGAAFSVQVLGTPPYVYQWRTNAVPVADATNDTFVAWYPGTDFSKWNYDVVVHDAFGSITSRVAKLVFTTNSPGILTPPASQLMLPGVSNATFSVVASGDEPLSYQWRSNGVVIADATNTSYTVTNPGPAAAAMSFDVVVSNPCGTATSSPPALVEFPNQFSEAFDAGAGFFGGENLVLTNASGLAYNVWSTPDLSLPVTAWTLEGPMSETPLGTTGLSRYGFNVNPITSPVCYIFALKNTGPYLNAEPLVWLTTSDFASFTITSTNLPINADGLFNPNSFVTAYDAGPGFFGGENLICTNGGGQTFGVWSSSNLSVSVTNWTYEGPMSETPLGTTGLSRYGLNVNPATSPVYYIIAHSNTGNFTSPEPVAWLTTSDFASFTLQTAEYPISSQGVFQLLLPPGIVQPPQSQAVFSGQSPSFQVTASGSQLSYQWVKSNGGLLPVTTPVLTLSNVSAAAAGSYYVIVSNALASATSSVATLTVVSPPVLKPALAVSPGLIQFNGSAITGLTYVVERATNLMNPVWLAVQTNNTGVSGSINFQTNATSSPSEFYRLVFP